MYMNVQGLERRELSARRTQDHQGSLALDDLSRDRILDRLIRQIEPCPQVERVTLDKSELDANLYYSLRRVDLSDVDSPQYCRSYPDIPHGVIVASCALRVAIKCRTAHVTALTAVCLCDWPVVHIHVCDRRDPLRLVGTTRTRWRRSIYRSK